MKPLKIVFAGTPEFAAKTLAAIIASEHQVIAAYTQPDRPAGRGRKLMASAVKQLAEQHGIPVNQPLSLKNAEAVAELAALQADLMVVVAYGLLLPVSVLNTPQLGCINVHASLLPRWRGAAPIQRAIAAGDTETGITIMQMDEGLDTGDMLLTEATPIKADDDGGSLHDRLAEMGANCCLQALEQLASGTTTATPQDNSQANYAHKLGKQDAELDWQQPAQTLHNQIRGFYPWPITHSKLGDSNIRIHQARLTHSNTGKAPGEILNADKAGILVATGAGDLLLTKLQLPGGKALAVADLLNAKKDLFQPGNRFDS